METNNKRQSAQYRPPVRSRSGPLIGDVAAPVRRLTVPVQASPQPVHAPSTPQATVPVQHRAPVQAQQHAPRTVTQHALAPTSHHSAAPATPDTPVISIRLSIPSFRKPRIPPQMKEYPGFWWGLLIIGLFLLTIGYQMGRSAGKKAATPQAAYVPTISQVRKA